MSTTTANLGLFKYNTTTDANVSFSITNALNNNWDKIDNNLKTPVPANAKFTDTNTLMTQNISTTDNSYPILACPTANATASQGAKSGIFSSKVVINPGKGTVASDRMLVRGADADEFIIRRTTNDGYSRIKFQNYNSSGTLQDLGYLGLNGNKRPVYSDSTNASHVLLLRGTTDGTAIGSTVKPVYISTTGTATALSATVGSTIKPIYLNAGAITASNATVGSSVTPVYLNAGAITACSDSLMTSTTSLGAEGYVKFSNSICFQWGSKQMTSGSLEVTFPISFTTHYKTITQLYSTGTGSFYGNGHLSAVSTTGFTIQNSQGAYKPYVYYIAVGKKS